VEVDRIAEPFLVPKTPASHLDHLDPAVEALSATIVCFQNNRIENAPQVFPDGPGDFLHWLKPTPYCPG